MIRGTIHNHEAIVELEVSGPGQPTQQIEAVIDTGYNGYLTLPSHLVTALQLPFVGHRRGTLADGSVARLDAYLATVVWHGQPKDVLKRKTQTSNRQAGRSRVPAWAFPEFRRYCLQPPNVVTHPAQSALWRSVSSIFSLRKIAA